MKSNFLLSVVFAGLLPAFSGCEKIEDNNPAEQQAIAAVNSEAEKGESPAVAASKIEGDKIVVYYFHGTRRCPSCKMIESLTTEVVEQGFAEQVTAGTIALISINIEDEENKHYIENFELFNKSVVLAEYKQGEPIRWKNLKDVWTLARKRARYLEYVHDEISAFLTNPQNPQ
jgi:thiol-disulfide isomerase/thioredoxin